jgi:hypothetical protein
MEILTDQQITAMISGETMQPGRDDSHLLQFTDSLTEEKVKKKLGKYDAQWKKFASTYENGLSRNYNAYKSQQVTVEGESVKIPEIFTLIETELPHLLNSIFGSSLIVDAKAKFVDPEDTRTYKVKNYINNLIKDVCGGKKKAEAIIKNMLIYGSSVIKCYWDTEPDYDIDVMTGMPIAVNSSHPNFDLVDPYCFAWDLNNQSQSIDNCEWVRERIFLPKDKMKMIRDNGECAWFDDDDMTMKEDKGKKARSKGSIGEEENSNTFYDEYSCTLYSEDEEGKTVSSEYIVWFLSGNKIIKFQQNPFHKKMYTVVRAYENPNEFMGQGEPDVVGALSAHLSYVHYQIGKMVKKVGQSLTKVTPAAGISPENLRRIEDGVIFLQDANGVTFEQTNDPMNVKVLMEAKEYLDNQIQTVTGIGRTLQGEPVGDQPLTATEASFLYQAASNRIAIKLAHLQEDMVKEIAERFFMMSKQLLEEPVEFFDTNNNLIQLTPADFLGNYNWIATGTITQSNKALQLQQNQQLLMGLINLMPVSAQTPNPFYIDIPYFIQQHLSPYANIPDSSKFIIAQPTPPPATVPGMPPTSPQNPPLQGSNPQVPAKQMSPETMSNPNAGTFNNIKGY